MGTLVSVEANLEKTVIGHFDRRGDIYVNATEGNVALVPCNAPISEQASTTVFEVNNTVLDISNSRRHKVLPSGNLQIANVKQSDQGVYRCSLVNQISEQTRASPNVVYLRVVTPVISPPKIVQGPQRDMEVVAGHTLTLECVVEGSPVPHVTWDKYGGVLPNGRFVQELGNLIISNVQKTDEGTYICRGENEIGQPQAEFSMVTVLGM